MKKFENLYTRDIRIPASLSNQVNRDFWQGEPVLDAFLIRIIFSGTRLNIKSLNSELKLQTLFKSLIEII